MKMKFYQYNSNTFAGQKGLLRALFLKTIQTTILL